MKCELASARGYERIPDAPYATVSAPPVKVSTRIRLLSAIFIIAIGAAACGGLYFFRQRALPLFSSAALNPGPTDSAVSVRVYQSSMAGDRFLEMTTELFGERGIFMDKLSFGNAYVPGADAPATDAVGSVLVDTSKELQEILGFGGAFTEASALNYQKLPVAVRKRVIDLYFSQTEGIGYSMGRIHINSCDFCVESYSFDDVAGDFGLEHFDMSVRHDQAAIIPFIRDAIAVAAANSPSGEVSPEMRLVASPWSPPAWMKVAVSLNASNANVLPLQSMLGSAKPDGLLSDARGSWAKYISKFVSAYTVQGVPIWAITPQNEPENAAPWEACVYTPDFESAFITEYLGPTLREDHPELLILGFDHNKDHLEKWAEALYGNSSSPSSSSGYVDGLAFHWYNGADDRLLDGTYGYNAVRSTHYKYPDKLLLATEGCSCPGVLLGDWFRGERLGHDVIFDLNSWASGWLDWNLIVDSQGGPNHLNNYCDAPLVTNQDFSDVIVQPKYYFMGHFSKFSSPGSRRLKSRIIGNFSNALENPNIQSGVELGIFPCEQSSRQLWTISNGLIKLAVPAISDVQMSDSIAVNLCVSLGNTDRAFLQMGVCPSSRSEGIPLRFEPSLLDISSVPDSIKLSAGAANIYRLVRERTLGGNSQCLSVHLGSQDGDEDGSLLVLAPCSSMELSQLWLVEDAPGLNGVSTIEPVSKALTSNPKHKACLTAGWPFLTGVAFSTGKGAISVVVMNEAPSAAKFALSLSSTPTDLAIGISPRSIETIVIALP